MFDFLTTIATPPPSARSVLFRLVGAFVLGWIVAWVYRRTRPQSKAGKSLQGTLVLLSILIATVTQVVGESPARAFSLVGALSIIRFRTVVQDTQDTAFVIFAVVMGMAAGADAPWMAVIGLGVVGAAAVVMRPQSRPEAAAGPFLGFALKIRVALGTDVEEVVKGPFTAQLSGHRLKAMETAKQGTAIEAIYEVAFGPEGSAESLLKALNRVEGVQNVQLEDTELDDD